MPTYQKADKTVEKLCQELIEKYDTNKPLDDQVIIDLVFAYGDRDDAGIQTGYALKKNGVPAYGQTRILPLKDRVMGRGDVEILLDADHWEKAGADEQAAILDHELHHIALDADKFGNIKFDDINRPKLKLRKHDVEFGWFSVIAHRHGRASIEQQQAKAVMDKAGQYFWPSIAAQLPPVTGATPTAVRTPFSKAAAVAA